jgi:hypothetical protein
MKFKEYILDGYLNEESLTIGDYVKQTGSDYEKYGIITKKLKNGSFYAKVFTSYDGRVTGKAKQASLSGWYPDPIKIKQKDIPTKILTKLN